MVLGLSKPIDCGNSVSFTYTCSCRNIHIYMLDTYRCNEQQTQEDFFINIFVPLTLLQGFQKGYSGFACEKELEIEHNCNILTPLLWSSTLCLSRSPGLLNRKPRAHFAWWWLPLLHLISIFSGPQLIRSPSPFSLVWFSLPHLVSLPLQLSATQLPLDFRLDCVI